MSKLSKRAITLFVIATMVLSMLSAFIAVPVMAVAVLTPATGGDAISADDFGTGSWTTLTGPILTETVPAEISIGTIVLTAPAGFEFNPLQVVTATVAPGDIAFTSTTATPTATTITFDVSAVSTAVSTITFSDIQVRPTTGTTPNTGEITKTGAATGLPAPGTYGTLTMVPGTATKLVYTVEPDHSGNTYEVFTTQPVVVIQDQYSNVVPSNDVVDLVAVDAITHTPGIGNLIGTTSKAAVAGVATFTDISYTETDTIHIEATSGSLALALGTSTITLTPASTSGFSIDYLSKTTVKYDDVIIVIGSGVTSGSSVELYWDFVTSASQLNTTTGLPDGNFECEVDVPSAYHGSHYIWAKDLATGLTTRSEAIHVDPKITLSPSSGLPKDNIIVKGYGFSEDSEIDITFAPDTLTVEDGEDETNELGYFEYTFKVKDLAGYGPYTVTAMDSVNSADEIFTVGAAITLDKTVGPAGTIVKVEGRGFTENSEIVTELEITLDGSTPVSTKDSENIDVSSTGTFTAYVVIPSVSEGEYELTLKDNSNNIIAMFEVDGETSITVTPGYGTPGTLLTVKGYNFTRVYGTEITLKLGTRTATAKTDASGSFTGTIVIPPCDLGDKYPVIANDTLLCHAEDEVLVTIIFLQLSDLSAPVGSDVILMGSGFTEGGGTENGEWNATFGDLDLITTTPITDGTTYFSETFHVPSLPSGTYTIGVYDVVREITVGIDFTVTEQAKLSVSRAAIPNKYNLTIEGVNFAEDLDIDDSIYFETTWWIYNSTDAWNLNDELNVTYGGTFIPTTDEDGEFTGYYKIPEFLELGSYTINCTTVSNTEVDPDIIQYAEVDIEIVPEEIVIHIGSPSYAKGQTITFVIKTTLKKVPFYLGIKDPEGSEYFNSTWDAVDDAWKTLGSWFYIPSNLQVDYNTAWLYTLPTDATPGTWTYSFWDEDKEYANGTFQVTHLTEIEQLQQDIGEIISGIEGMGASNTELAALVADLQGASAEAVAAAAAAAAAAGDAQTAAEAAMAAISDVDDTAGAALDAANDAKSAADAAKDAADAGLQAANAAQATSQAAADAAQDAADAAEANQRSTSGLTTLVYGAIGASLIAALAAIVSLMQISRRIAG